jgi:hypothetical protein
MDGVAKAVIAGLAFESAFFKTKIHESYFLGRFNSMLES